MKRALLFLFSVVLTTCYSQIVNAYANVTAISGTTLTVNNVDETSHTFEDADFVVLMQMQDNCIGSNTTNISTFGDLASIQSAGLYEIIQISSHIEAAGLPVSIVLSNAPMNTYNLNANSSVQLITFRKYGSPDYTTTANMAAKQWNGTTGGVLAFQVTGTLTLAHNLNVNGLGFRGGALSANYYSGGSGCSTTEYIRFSNHTRAGAKGEGIYKTATTDFLYSRGHLLNGGGGGSERINCGGGGGGNYTMGGLGGDGWSCAGPGGGGIGGISLATQISATRIFMGGGGGGGQQNNSQSTAGGNGGGIILIKAGSIITQGACGGRVISANGATVTGLTNDGQGGGGAAGSIVIETNSFNVLGACALTVSANGGSGGTVNTSAHAGGGGGAQGVVIYSTTQPTANITTVVNNGPAGCNDNSSPCTNLAGAPTGTNNSGILTNGTTPLPIELVDFNGKINSYGNIELNWKTSSEKNNAFYELQRSDDGSNWEVICVKKGAGTTSNFRIYKYIDSFEFNKSFYYYRLRQVDLDESFSYSSIIAIQKEELETNDISIFPNPNKGQFTVQINSSPNIQEVHMIIYSSTGQEIYDKFHGVFPANLNLDFVSESKLNPGVYLLRLDFNGKNYLKKFFVVD